MNDDAGSSRNKNETKNFELYLRRAFRAYKTEIQEYKSQIDNLVASQSTRENAKCKKCEDFQISVQELNKLLKESREKLDEKDRIIANLQLKLREKSTSASFHKSPLKERKKRCASSDDDVLHVEKENMLTKKLKPNNFKSSPIKPRVTIIPETLDIDIAIEDHRPTNKVLVPETLDIIETEKGHEHAQVLIPETLDIETEQYSHKASKETILVPETLEVDFPVCINVKDRSKPFENDYILSKRILTGDTAKSEEHQGLLAPLNTSTPKKRAETVKNCHKSERTNDIIITCPDPKVPTQTSQSDSATPDLLFSSYPKRPQESHGTNTSNQNKSLNDSSDFFEAALVNLRKNKVQEANNKPVRKNLKSTMKKSTSVVVQIEPKKPGHKSPKLIQTKINKDMFTKRRTVLDKDLEAAISESLKDTAKPIPNADVCIITEPSTSKRRDKSPVTVLCDDCSSNDSEDLLAEIGAVSPKNRNAEEEDVKPKSKKPVRLGPYDKVPEEEGPSYKYKHDPIRKKDERAKLNVYMCSECEQFNQALPDALRNKELQKCSRHKDVNGAPPTPGFFWSFSKSSPE